MGISGTRGWAGSCEYNDKQGLLFWGQYVPVGQLPVVAVRDQYSAGHMLHNQCSDGA